MAKKHRLYTQTYAFYAVLCLFPSYTLAMFTGAINSGVRAFLAQMAPLLNGKTCVVGCSGNFTSETVLSATAKPKAIYSNDISLYSCLAGAYLTNKEFPLKVSDDNFSWLGAYCQSTLDKLATVMVLLDMLPHEKQNNAFKKRMWAGYLEKFPELFEKTQERISKVEARIDGFYAGDVYDHFQQHDTPDAVFMCYAPTYAGGYERLYKRLEQIFEWDEPTYSMLDNDARDRLFSWMRERRYVWYDDRLIEGVTPIMLQKSGRAKTVYIYSNLNQRPIYLVDNIPPGLPKIPLATEKTVITENSHIELKQIKTSDLARFKNAFLGKNIVFSQGGWAFCVVVDCVTVGFLEFSRGKYKADELYINSDFAIPGTRYKRLSKLMVMLAVCGETRRTMEKINQLRLNTVCTTAFTERPVSMKYRGIMELIKRGKGADGKSFLNYEAKFNTSTWKEVLSEWVKKHASANS